MSDIIVIQPDENNVVVSEVTNSITTASDGPQGPAGPTGPAGSSGVVAVTAPITNSGTSSSANIGISAGTTSAAGALQLTDSVASTSTTTAATPNAVKTAYDLADSKNFITKTQTAVYVRTPTPQQTGGGAGPNVSYYQPMYITGSVTADRIAVYTGPTFSGTATIRLGIYNNDSATGRPSTVLVDAGTVSVTASNSIFQITINQSLTAGFYWLVFNQQGAPTVSNWFGCGASQTVNPLIQATTSPSIAQINGYSQSSVTGAFATAGTLAFVQAYPFAWIRTA